MSTTPGSLEKQSIWFDNGRAGEILHVGPVIEPTEIWNALDIAEAPSAAIIIAGGAKPFNSRLKNRLTDLFSRGVAQAAAECNALIIDEGTKSGVSEIVGQGVADRGRKTKLIGVPSPRSGATPDATAGEDHSDFEKNHTHFVLYGQESATWQAETMCQLAELASQNKDWILTILVGGETQGSTMDLALQTVRRGWQLIVIEDSGPLANQIIRFKKIKLAAEKPINPVWKRINPFLAINRLARLREKNPRLYEIINDGKILIVGKRFDAIQLRNVIKGLFTHPPKENILWVAWQRFAEYDQNSSRHRNQWHQFKRIPLNLAVLSTLLVLIYEANPVGGQGQTLVWQTGYGEVMSFFSSLRGNWFMDFLLRFIIVLFPITSSVILAIETRRKLGSKYILLRGAAEAVKRGIYSFRVLNGRTGNETQQLLPTDEKSLAMHLGKITNVLLESDVKESALARYEGRIPPNMFGAEAYDDGFSPLDAETYMRIRIGDQLKFYTMRTNQYEKEIRQLQNRMLIIGGIGTFLAAIGAQYWLPLTAAVVASTTAYLEYQQLEQLLTKYNLTKASLDDARSKWLALPENERNRDDHVQNLVREVEAILESENQGWVQYVSQVQEAEKANGNALQK